MQKSIGSPLRYSETIDGENAGQRGPFRAVENKGVGGRAKEGKEPPLPAFRGTGKDEGGSTNPKGIAL